MLCQFDGDGHSSCLESGIAEKHIFMHRRSCTISTLECKREILLDTAIFKFLHTWAYLSEAFQYSWEVSRIESISGKYRATRGLNRENNSRINLTISTFPFSSFLGVKTGRENPVPTGSVFRFTRPYTVFIGKTGNRSGNGKKVSVAGTEMIVRFS